MSSGDEETPITEQEKLLVETARSVGLFLKQFALWLSDDVVVDIAAAVAREQVYSVDAMILPTLVDEYAESHPTLQLVVQIIGSDAPVEQRTVMMQGAKRLSPDLDVQTLAQSAVLLALLSAPHIRAMLRACNVGYAFQQSPEPIARKPRILL